MKKYISLIALMSVCNPLMSGADALVAPAQDVDAVQLVAEEMSNEFSPETLMEHEDDPSRQSLSLLPQDESPDASKHHPEPIAQAIESKDHAEHEDDVADIYLNFQDASLATVVNSFTEQRNINLVPHKGLEAVKVSLSTQQGMTFKQAWNVLYSMLASNGFTIKQVGDLYQIAPLKQAGQGPLTFYSSRRGVEPEDLPDTNQVVRYMYFFTNARAAQMQQILSRMLDEGSVKVNNDLEAVIITEKSLNIKAAMQIAKELDLGGLRESLKILRLHHADAGQLAQLFQSIMAKPQQQQGNIRFLTPDTNKEAAYFSPSTKIIPNPLKNSLILLGTQEHMNRIISFIKKHLDRPPEAAESRLHIKEIKYASATKLKPILSAMIRPPGGHKEIVGDFKFFEDVIIAAEEASNDPQDLRGSGNRLIVSANKDDWRRLEKFIDKLDVPAPQIALEVMIVDVTDNITRELGAQLRNKPGWLGRGVCGETMHIQGIASDQFIDDINLISVPASFSSAGGEPTSGTYLTAGAAIDAQNPNSNGIWATIKTVLSENAADIVSQPYLVVNNGENASIEVKTTRRVDGEINDPSKSGGARTRSKVDFDATTKVTLRPRINSQGVVNLSIDVTISEFQEQETENLQPTTSDRLLKTIASMGTGEVLIVGGLTRTEISQTVSKTPILGDIPLIGNLFRNKSQTESKTNLYIFIRPSVIKPVFEGKPDDYTELKLAYAKYQILGHDTYLKVEDPIQRWFFKPRSTSIKQTLEDLAHGRYRPLDEFTQGKQHPRSVDMQRDPFYETSERLAKLKAASEKRRLRHLGHLKRRKMMTPDASVALPHESEPMPEQAAPPMKGLNALHSFAMR